MSLSSGNSFSVAIRKNVSSIKAAGTKGSIFTPAKVKTTNNNFEKFNAEVDRWISWRDGRGRRAFTLPVSACSDEAEVIALDRISMADWMNERGLSSPRLRWWVNYACRDDYGMELEQTSAWAGLFYFCSRVVEPGVESQSLITWPEGNGRLVQHLFEKTKTNIQLDRAAVELIPVQDGVDVITLDREGSKPAWFSCTSRDLRSAAVHGAIRRQALSRQSATAHFGVSVWRVDGCEFDVEGPAETWFAS